MGRKDLCNCNEDNEGNFRETSRMQQTVLIFLLVFRKTRKIINFFCAVSCT